MSIIGHIINPFDVGSLPWEQGGRRGPRTLGISLASGSDYYYSATGIFAASGARSMWIRWRPDAAAPAGTRCVVDSTSFGATGAAVIVEPNPLTGATDGRLLGWNGAYAPSPTRSVKVMTPAEYGASRKIRTSMVWIGADGNFHFAEGGYEVGVGGVSGTSTFNTSNRVGVNTRAGALGTLPYGAMTIFEVQFSTLQPSAADVLAIAQAPLGTQWTGATHHWKPDPSWVSGAAGPASWVDSIGSAAMTRAGTGTTIVSHTLGVYAGLPSFQIMGDSIAAGRQSGGALGNGWRRQLQHDLSAAGRICAIAGSLSATSSTPDFDADHRAVGGQALGVPASAITPRIDTIATDRSADAPANGITILAYGANDLPYRVGTLAQSTTAARDSFFADMTTVLDSIRGVRATGKIIVCNVLKQATGSSSANDRAAIDAVNAGLAAHLAARADSNLSLFDANALLTPLQANADDTNVLFDGVHPSPAAYASYGAAMAAHVLGLGL